MFKLPSIRRNISLYKNSCFIGYVYINAIESLLIQSKEAARQTADGISWDRVILYAIFDYDPKSQEILSADFMNIVMKYEDYAEFVDKMTNSKRFFFVRGRKEYKYE